MNMLIDTIKQELSRLYFWLLANKLSLNSPKTHCAKHTYSGHCYIVPKPIQNLYKSNKNIHTHFTRHAHHFNTMRGNNEFIYISFAFQSVLIWNKLLQNINIHVSYTRLKHLLKDFLLSNVIAFRYDK